MKKIIFVFCTLMFLLSANATPPAFQAPSLAKKAHKTEHRVDVQKLEHKSRAAILKNQQQTVSQNQNDVRTYAVQGLSQRKATQADYQLTIKSVTITYNTESVNYFFTSEDGKVDVQLSITLDEGQQDVEYDKTYTINDMLWTSWVKDGNSVEEGEIADEVWLNEASFKKSLNSDNTNHYEVSASTFFDTYSFVFDEPKEEEFVPNGDTIYINFTEPATLTYYTGNNSAEWRAYNNDYDVMITYFPTVADSPVGTYTETDCDLVYTYVHPGIERPKTVTAEIEVTQNENANKYELTANLLCEDGYVYAVTMFRNIAQAENFVEITATNLAIDGSWTDVGVVWVEAYDDTYFVELMVNAPATGAALAGTYDANVDFNGWISDDNDGDFTIEAGSITIGYNEGSYILTGQVLADNNTEYTLNLSYTLPEPTEQALTLDNLILYKFNGGWQVYGYSADSTKFLTLAAYSDRTSGQFTGSELASDYSLIILNADQDDEALYNLVDADITLTPNEDYSEATITGTFLGLNYYDSSDAVRFTLNLSAEELDPTQAHYPYDTESGEYNEDFEQYTVSARSTYFVIEAEKDNGAYVMLAVYPAAGQTQLTAGTYDITMTGDYMTVAAGMSTSDGALYPSFAGYLNSAGAITNLWLLEAGTMTISETGEITVEAVNSYAQTVKFTLAEASQALEYDTNSDFVHDFESYEYYDDYFDYYGMLEVYYMSDEYYAEIMFKTDSNPLNPGVYPINDTYALNTVVASTGYDAEYGPNPSYIATLIDYYGTIYLNDLWYMVGGTVTVNEDGTIEVDAVNSYGKSIKSKFGLGATAVETVTVTGATAVKRVVEGNLFIESNGRVFNAQGALVK